MRETLRLLRHHGVALTATALAVLLTLVLWPHSQRFPFALFIAAVMVSVWQGGPRSALLTTVLSTVALALLYCFLWATPQADPRQEYLPRLGMFVLVGLLATYLSRECRRAVQALDQVHATLASTGEALLLTDDQGRITFLSPLAQSLTGWQPHEAEAQPLDQVFRLVDGATQQALAPLASGMLQAGIGSDLAEQALLVSATGTQTPIAGRLTPLHGTENRVVGLGLAFRDATPRRRAEREWRERQQAEANLRERTEKALQESEERLEVFLDHLPGLAFLKDGQGRYVYVNHAYEQFLQGERGARQSESEVELPVGPPNPFEENEQAVRETQKTCEQVVVVRVHESERHFLVRQFLIRNGSEDAGLLGGIALDLSAQKRAEAALHQAQEDYGRQLQESRVAQEQAEEALRRAREDHQKELEARCRGQRQAEEALRQAQEDFSRQLQECVAGQRKAEEAQVRAREECSRQVEQLAAALAAAEEALGRVQEDCAAQLEERTTQHRATVASLRQEVEDLTRQLEECSAAQQQQEESLRQSCQALQRQLNERTVAHQQAEEALQRIQREWERQVEDEGAAHHQALAALRAKLAQSEQVQEQLQANLEQCRQAEEAVRKELVLCRQDRAEPPSTGSQANGHPEPAPVATLPFAPPDPGDWLAFN